MTKVIPASVEIHASIRQDIMHCILSPGAKIDAGDLATRYGVSKSPVRDALRRLEAEGLVTVMSRSGYRVRPITMQEVHEILEMRLALGPYAARRAAELITTAEIAELRTILAEYNQPMDIAEMQQIARRFHIGVARCSRNRRLVAQSEMLFDELERLLRTAIDFTLKAQQHSEEHKALIDALEARNGDLAAQIEADHIIRAKQFLIDRLMTTSALGDEPVRMQNQ